MPWGIREARSPSVVTKGEKDIERCREGDPRDERDQHVRTRPPDKTRVGVGEVEEV